MEQGIVAEGIPADQTNLKFCADCKHLIGVRYAVDEAAERWRCGHPKNIKAEVINLVTGIKKKIFVHDSIELLRQAADWNCGPEGKWYEEYIPPEREPEKQKDPGPQTSVKSGGKKFSLDL